jgi:hypothetical protein
MIETIEILRDKKLMKGIEAQEMISKPAEYMS